MTFKKTYFCNSCYVKFTIELDEIDAELIPEFCPFCVSEDIEEYEDVEDFDDE